MQNITVNDAVGQALAEEMRRDARVLTFGEGVATNRRDLLAEFGPQRVRNTPLAEGIIAGAAAGALLTITRAIRCPSYQRTLIRDRSSPIAGCVPVEFSCGIK